MVERSSMEWRTRVTSEFRSVIDIAAATLGVTPNASPIADSLERFIANAIEGDRIRKERGQRRGRAGPIEKTLDDMASALSTVEQLHTKLPTELAEEIDTSALNALGLGKALESSVTVASIFSLIYETVERIRGEPRQRPGRSSRPAKSEAYLVVLEAGLLWSRLFDRRPIVITTGSTASGPFCVFVAGVFEAVEVDADNEFYAKWASKVVPMLPAGGHVREVWLSESGKPTIAKFVSPNVHNPKTSLIDIRELPLSSGPRRKVGRQE